MSHLSCRVGMGGIRELLDEKIWEWDLSFRWKWEWDGNGQCFFVTVKHLIMLRKIKFYRNLLYSCNTVLSSAFCDGTSRYGVPENLTTS